MSQTGPAWIGRVRARLDARLERDVGRPLAIALSGGGDSVALLRLAADWARDNGRRLLALTVDHGLNPDSAGWTDFAATAARAAGADWRGLAWTGDKPATGLPAAARAARHHLIAKGAREAGARVVLFAHTADDLAEGEWMRDEGSTLGRPRDWAPSPAWPEGRGLMLLRPLLDVSRGDLRDWLRAEGADWIEDPANADPTYARSRARAALGVSASSARPPVRTPFEGPLPVPLEDGVLRLERSVRAPVLSAALVCAGGGDRLPRGDRLNRIADRLAAREDFTATLCGARLEALGDQVLVTREVGELARRPPPPLVLAQGVEAVWDGRWALVAHEPGWAAAPASGRMAALSRADRSRLDALPRAARGAWPVLIRNDPPATVLAGSAASAHSLVEERLALALDRMTHETGLGPRAHGATPRNNLFSNADITEERSATRSEGSRQA